MSGMLSRNVFVGSEGQGSGWIVGKVKVMQFKPISNDK
jgi:hypothetical protein